MFLKWFDFVVPVTTPSQAPREMEESQATSRLSSIGAKAIVGITGLGLTAFVIVHMLGNLQIYLGQDALNEYARKLKDMPALLWTARSGLLALFVTHIALAVGAWQRNRKARPVRYQHPNTVQASIASRTMILSGVGLLAFVIYHLAHFTLGLTHSEHHELIDEKGRHDVYSMVVLGFQQPIVAIFYVMAMLLLAAHLSHGVSSAFKSTGLSGERGTRFMRLAGLTVALLVAAGNISIPVSVMLGLIKLPGGGN